MEHLSEQQAEPRFAGYRPQAAAIPAAPPTVTVTVKTSDKSTTRIVATPDSTVGEIMVQACRDLGIRDRQRWALVAAGEVTADAWPVGDLATDGELNMRLVKKPEAGA